MTARRRHTMSLDRYTVSRAYAFVSLLVLAGIAYGCFTTPLPTRRPDVQSTLYSQVPTARPGPPPVATPAAPGKALAYMRIPRFGHDWLWTASEGITDDVLATGPGHYPGTALPGDVGNSAFAAHRAGHGDPFIDFDQLRPGDTVKLSQSGATWTYRLTTAPAIVDPNAHWIIDVFAPGRWLTLTTCWPRYGNAKRMYVRAELVDVTD